MSAGALSESALRQHRAKHAPYCRTLDRLDPATMEELDLLRLMTTDTGQAGAAQAMGFEVVVTPGLD